jgi:hypothetical protein
LKRSYLTIYKKDLNLEQSQTHKTNVSSAKVSRTEADFQLENDARNQNLNFTKVLIDGLKQTNTSSFKLFCGNKNKKSDRTFTVRNLRNQIFVGWVEIICIGHIFNMLGIYSESDENILQDNLKIYILVNIGNNVSEQFEL